ncbi:unnamed protein product [Sphenostylis stenocarpa]|uniref:Small ribosomal subunit protein uS17 n=1 Tax=Sphenostylis stenocarpa TaxID=92480 RepID=A0AA86SPC7_9FABA|nr:unnamed protein product [Sphenostylis stenocarpa]
MDEETRKGEIKIDVGEGSILAVGWETAPHTYALRYYFQGLYSSKSQPTKSPEPEISTKSSVFLRIRVSEVIRVFGVQHSSLQLLPSSPFTMAEQTEKAFLKQPKVFLSSKKTGKGKRPGKGGNRFWKSIGLGFKTPREAIEGTYIDKKCPFTGNVSIRGRILAGTCHSAKMNRTIIVRRNYLHFIKKYQRYEKRHSNIAAHISPCFRVKEGDHVIIGQCRPLSKTVRFNVLKVIPAGSSSGAKKAFTGMILSYAVVL